MWAQSAMNNVSKNCHTRKYLALRAFCLLTMQKLNFQLYLFWKKNDRGKYEFGWKTELFSSVNKIFSFTFAQPFILPKKISFPIAPAWTVSVTWMPSYPPQSMPWGADIFNQHCCRSANSISSIHTSYIHGLQNRINQDLSIQISSCTSIAFTVCYSSFKLLSRLLSSPFQQHLL